MTTDILDQEEDLDAAFEWMAQEIAGLVTLLNATPKPFSLATPHGRYRRYQQQTRQLHRRRA